MTEQASGRSFGARLRADVEQTKADVERGVEALRRDLEQTKAHLTGGRAGADLDQTAGDTVLQALGREPIPQDGAPNPEPEAVRLDPEEALPHCTECEQALVNEEACWVCVEGHGHAAIYSVATGLIGPVAVHAVQSAAEEATEADGRACPFCAGAMVVIDLEWDETDTSALLHQGGPQRGHAQLEACTVDRLIWFDRESADAIPPP